MKRTIFILILLFMTGTASVWGQTEILFDISKGSVRFTDESYTGKDQSGATVSGVHTPGENKYIITGTTVEYDATTRLSTLSCSA